MYCFLLSHNIIWGTTLCWAAVCSLALLQFLFGWEARQRCLKTSAAVTVKLPGKALCPINSPKNPINGPKKIRRTQLTVAMGKAQSKTNLFEEGFLMLEDNTTVYLGISTDMIESWNLMYWSCICLRSGTRVSQKPTPVGRWYSLNLLWNIHYDGP